MTNLQSAAPAAHILPPSMILESYFAMPGPAIHYLLRLRDRPRVEALLAKILPDHAPRDRWTELAAWCDECADEMADPNAWPNGATIAPSPSPAYRNRDTLVASLGEYASSRANVCDLLMGGLSLSDSGFFAREDGTDDMRLERARSDALEPVDMLREILRLRSKATATRNLVASSLTRSTLDELCSPDAMLLIGPGDRAALSGGAPQGGEWIGYRLTLDDRLARKLYRARISGPGSLEVDANRIHLFARKNEISRMSEHAQILWHVPIGHTAPLNGTVLSEMLPVRAGSADVQDDLPDAIRGDLAAEAPGPLVTPGSGPDAYIRAMLIALGSAMREEMKHEAPGRIAREVQSRTATKAPALVGAQLVRAASI